MNRRVIHIIECMAIVAVAFALRFIFIGKADIGNDECFSLYYAQKSLADIVCSLSDYDNPPLWELILHFWIAAVGIGIVALRSLSAIFSTLTVIPIYLTGERHIGRGSGVIASLMYAFASFSLFLAHDGRVYSLIGMLSAWSLFLFLSIINSNKKRPVHWTLLTTCNILLFYGHYMTIWVPACQLLTIFLIPKYRHYIKKYLLSLAVFIVAYLPMVVTLAGRIADSGFHGTWIAKTHSFDSLYHMMCSLTNAPVTASLLLIVVGIAAVMAIIQIAKKTFQPTNATVLSLMWAIPLLVSFAVSFFLGMFLNRYFYFILPTYLLSIAAYIRRIAPKPLWFNTLCNVTAIILMTVTFNPDSTTMRHGGWKGDTRAVATKIKQLNSHSDCNILLAPAWIDKQIVYYFDDDHLAFAQQGKLEQPVFYNYLTPKGFIYCDSLQIPTKPTVYVVQEPWYNIDEWLELLSQYGYKQTDLDHHQQIDILTFRLDTE